MKLLSVILMCFLGLSCSTVVVSENTQDTPTIKEYKARVTYYYPQSPYWSKVSCPKSKTAKEGITIAAHPDFKYGTKLYIPELKSAVGNGVFTVQDRGPAVTRKVASRGRAYVFDVFVSSNAKLRHMTSLKPEYMKVYVVLDK
jgi:3D (Asp-Asp-Asp) domain-containing protein